MEKFNSYCEKVNQHIQHKESISLDSIFKLKKAENSVRPESLDFKQKGLFWELQKQSNKEIAYWLNHHIDIIPFVENAGYEKKHSTQRWPRYEKGGEVFLITDSNTLWNPKTGNNTNLYDFIQLHYPPSNLKISRTQNMVDTVLRYEGLQIYKKPEMSLSDKKVHLPREAAKEFDLKAFRVEPLDSSKNFLVTRGITPDTLNNKLFKGSILQGNKGDVNRHYNNVIYPFKTSPADHNNEMKTLLQQYGRKVAFAGKQIDKIFAPGNGKSRSIWFSNMPDKIQQVYVFENPLDALSHFQKYKPNNSLYCATGGNPAQEQYRVIAETCKNHLSNPVLCFDNDMAGCRFDTAFIASQKPDRLTIDKVIGEIYHVKISNLTVLEMKNCEMVLNAKGINVVSKGEGEIIVEVSSLDKACFLNIFLEDSITKVGVIIEKSVSKDFNEDLKQGFQKSYSSTANHSKSISL